MSSQWEYTDGDSSHQLTNSNAQLPQIYIEAEYQSIWDLGIDLKANMGV